MASRGKIAARKRVNAARRLALFERRRQRAERTLPHTPELLYAGPAATVQRSLEVMQFNQTRLERDLARI